MTDAAPTEDLLTRLENGVLWLTVNRADAQNSLTHDLRTQLVEQLERASADLAVRAVVIGAAGERAFCTGADLRSRPPGMPKPEGAPDRVVGDAARMIRTGWGKLVAAIQDCEKPVIAAVNGTAAGGGVHLALACDLVIAAESARFIEVFVRRGIAPDAGGAYLLPRLIGLSKAKELCFFGDDVSATEAERIGLINKVVPLSDLEKTVTEWAERLASGPTKAIGAAKRLLNSSLETSRAQAFADESYAQELVNGTEDAREGMMSFVEKRAPEFKGW
jgi:2-(1,2-epoxy-1,2-dihydrophenyl)acetyl-CoA isomerase